MIITVDIAKEFTNKPGARDYEDGKNSGLEFFEKILRPKYIEAQNQDARLKVILDGTEGYASSFLNESFSLLGNEFGPDNVWGRLIVISNEIPKYIEKVKKGVYEIRK